MDGQQLDLFGEVEAAAAAVERQKRERTLWAEFFETAPWVAPYDCASGLREGQSTPGVTCPDPACREVTPNGFILSINHGFDPDVPGRGAHQRCWKVRREQPDADPWPGLPWPLMEEE